MEPRLNFREAAPEGMRTFFMLEHYVNNCGLERTLLDLVRIRASQIYGCAYCIDMHAKEARAGGETEQRIYALDAWRETSFYTARERAGLDLAESVTLIDQGHVPDEVYEAARKQFTEKELVDLALAVISVNGGIRLTTAFRVVPGSYQVHKREPAQAQA